MLDRKTAIEALQWHIDVGANEALASEPVDATAMPDFRKQLAGDKIQETKSKISVVPSSTPDTATPLGKNEAHTKAVKLALQATTLDELREAITGFDGLGIKKTAKNTVFSDGNPKAAVMLIGEAPGAEEDHQGKPFADTHGQLLDEIMKHIGLGRETEDPATSLYISNILSWRPPGGRTPSQAEIEISLPFIERHIALIQPKILVLYGGTTAKSLLGQDMSLSRLRKTWHDYKPQTPELAEKAVPIPAIVTYPPAYLQQTPAQKRAAWQDALMLRAKMRELNIL